MSTDKHLIPGDFEVIRCDLPAFIGDWAQMEYGDPLAPRSVQLREEYRLDSVVAGCDTEFEAQRALKRLRLRANGLSCAGDNGKHRPINDMGSS